MKVITVYRSKRHGAPRKRKRRIRDKIIKAAGYIYHGYCAVLKFDRILTEDEYQIMSSYFRDIATEPKEQS